MATNPETDRSFVWIAMLAVGIATISPIAALQGAPQPGAERAPSMQPLPSVGTQPEPRPELGKADPYQPLREFFQRDHIEEALSDPTRLLGWEIHYLVVTVPDPQESSVDYSFDRTLDALSAALSSLDYERDRFLLPWPLRRAGLSGGAGGAAPPPDRPYVRAPGVLLFRKMATLGASGSKDTPQLLVALLVGETPTWGVHPQALAMALDMAAADVRSSQIGILGPYFSGTVPSLRRGLEAFACRRTDRALRFDVVSGSATNRENARGMEASAPPGAVRCNQFFPGHMAAPPVAGNGPFIRYSTTQVNDDELLQRFYRWLQSDMGVHDDGGRLRGVALLAERDTAYGQPFVGARSLSGGELEAPSIPFPLRVSRIRSAYERSRAPRQGEVPVPRRALELTLDDPESSRELPPAYSAKSLYTDELVLSGAIDIACRPPGVKWGRPQDLRFLGILATNTSDALFLAREVRRFCRTPRLFFVTSDILFTHPDYHDDLAGSLVISPYPLASIPLTGARTGQPGEPQFADSTAEGVFDAVLALLGPRSRTEAPGRLEPPAHPVWITAVGNGRFVPVARLVDGTKGRPRRGGWVVHRGRGFLGLAGTLAAAGLLLVVVALRSLRAEGPITGPLAFRDALRPGIFHPLRRRINALACIGPAAAVLTFAAIVLSAPTTGRAEAWSNRRPYPVLVPVLLAACALVGASVAISFQLLAAAIRRRVALRTPSSSRRGLVVLALAAAFATAAVIWSTGATPRVSVLLRSDRVGLLGSGVNPLLPMVLFAGALFMCGYQNLRRLEALETHAFTNPLSTGDDSFRAGLATLQASLLTALSRPAGGTSALTLTLGGTLGLWELFRPALVSLEGRWFDVALLVTLAPLLFSILGAASMALIAWTRLRRMLRRFACMPLVEGFARLPAPFVRRIQVLARVPYAPDMGMPLLQLRALADMPRPAALLRDEAVPPRVRAAVLEALDAVPDLERAMAAANVEAARRHRDRPSVPAAVRKPLQRCAIALADLLAWTWERRVVAATPIDQLAARSSGEAARGRSTLEIVREQRGGDEGVWLRLAEEYVCGLTAVFIFAVSTQIRRLLTLLTSALLLLLLALVVYPFENEHRLLQLMWPLVLGGIGVCLWIIVAMERDEVLSRIARTEPGRVTWSWAFVFRLAAFVLLPVLGLLAAQFPALGGPLLSWFEPLLRSRGG